MIPCPFCNAQSKEVKNHIDDHIISCPNCGTLAYKKNIQIYNSETKAKVAIACAIITCLSKGKTIEIQNTNNNIYLNNKSIDDFEPKLLSQKTILTLLCLTIISIKKDFIELNDHNLGPFGARNSEERKQIIDELSQKK